MRDVDFQRAFDQYIAGIRRSEDRKKYEQMQWKADLRAHFSSIRSSLEAAGLESLDAMQLATRDPVPTRDVDTFSYLRYRIALAYINALEAVQLLYEETNPWHIAQITEVVAAFDNDAYSFAEELVELCSDWWTQE